MPATETTLEHTINGVITANRLNDWLDKYRYKVVEFQPSSDAGQRQAQIDLWVGCCEVQDFIEDRLDCMCRPGFNQRQDNMPDVELSDLWDILAARYQERMTIRDHAHYEYFVRKQVGNVCVRRFIRACCREFTLPIPAHPSQQKPVVDADEAVLPSGEPPKPGAIRP